MTQIQRHQKRVCQLTKGIQELYKKMSRSVLEIQTNSLSELKELLYDQFRFQDKDPLILLDLIAKLIDNLLKFNQQLSKHSDCSSKLKIYEDLTPQNAKQLYIDFIDNNIKKIKQLQKKTIQLQYQKQNYCQKIKACQYSSMRNISDAQKVIKEIKEKYFNLIKQLQQLKDKVKNIKQENRVLEFHNRSLKINLDKMSQNYEQYRMIKKSWVREKQVLQKKWSDYVDQLQRKIQIMLKNK